MSIGIGDALRQAREELGRTQADAAQSLRIRSEYVEALEEEEFGVFGADTYARGHLRNYARYLGLDPQPLLDQYDRYVRTDDRTAHHFADAPVAVKQRDPLPRWVVGLGVVIAVLGGAALIGLIGSRTPPPAEQPSDLPTVADSTSASPTAGSSPTISDSPSPSPSFEGVNVFLAFEGDCWVSIDVDGQPGPRSGTVLTSGETLELQGDQQIEITYGSAGNVIVTYNGELLGSPGGAGEVVTVTYGPDGQIQQA